MGELMGTPEALEAGSYENQCKNWCSYFTLCECLYLFPQKLYLFPQKPTAS